MSWIVGSQNKPKNNPQETYDKLNSLQGFLREDEAKRWLYEFFREDVSFACYMLMGVKLAPHQHMMVKAMMNNDYILNILGRGSGKSFLAAIFAGLYALLNPGVNIGILSASFRQSKLLFKKLEDISNERGAEAFRNCITKNSKNSDMWHMSIGRSNLYALPLGSGEKLRGFRFQCLLIDELLLMPEKTLNEVILPFLGVVPNPTERQDLREAEDLLIENGEMEEKDRFIWPNNKFVGLSSASYKFEYLYELYQVYERLIMGKSGQGITETQKELIEKMSDKQASRAVFHMSYEAIPEYFYDQNLIAQALDSMSEQQFAREFKSSFIDDSGGYFNIQKMRDCTVDDGMEPSVQIKGDNNKKYLLSMDPSWSEEDSSDDFAIQLFELNDDRSWGTLVHSYARSGETLKNHIKYFHYLFKNFNIVSIWADHAGGVTFINACNESVLFKTDNINLKSIDEDFDDVENYSKCIRRAKSQYNLESNTIVFYRKFGSANWIRRSNELLQANITHKRIWFGGRCCDETYQIQKGKQVNLTGIKFNQKDEDALYNEKDPEAKKIELIEKLYDLVNLTKAECALIEVKANPQGHQTFDLPQNLKRQTGPNRTRRDSYTALLIGNWGIEKYYDMTSNRVKVESNTFQPFFM